MLHMILGWFLETRFNTLSDKETRVISLTPLNGVVRTGFARMNPQDFLGGRDYDIYYHYFLISSNREEYFQGQYVIALYPSRNGKYVFEKSLVLDEQLRIINSTKYLFPIC